MHLIIQITEENVQSPTIGLKVRPEGRMHNHCHHPLNFLISKTHFAIQTHQLHHLLLGQLPYKISSAYRLKHHLNKVEEKVSDWSSCYTVPVSTP